MKQNFYVWNWVGGGYNQTYAADKTQALEQAHYKHLRDTTPDLLAALEELYALPDLHERVKSGSVRYIDALARARIAIAKAKGEA